MWFRGICVVLCIVVLFFFFKQKTAYEMRISDWSSDVCSSDLLAMQSSVSPLHSLSPWDVAAFIISAHSSLICDAVTAALDIAGADAKATSWAKIGRASCRERVCQYV